MDNTNGNKGLIWKSNPTTYGSKNYWDTSGSDISTNHIFANNIISNDISANDISCVDISAAGYFFGSDHFLELAKRVHQKQKRSELTTGKNLFY
jgi:hypothetical protein